MEISPGGSVNRFTSTNQPADISTFRNSGLNPREPKMDCENKSDANSAIKGECVNSDDHYDASQGSSDNQEAKSLSEPVLALHKNLTPSPKRRRSSKPNHLVHSPSIQSARLPRSVPRPLALEKTIASKAGALPGASPSPMPSSIPAPPNSLPTYLELELSTDRPSPLYIHRPVTSDLPYESSRVKIERLLNFLLLPPQLEQVLWFGALACLDAWLYSFTILPLRFLKALSILAQSWASNLAEEFSSIVSIIYSGFGRMWHQRQRAKIVSSAEGKLNGEMQTSTRREDKAPSNFSKQQNRFLPEPRIPPNQKQKGSNGHRYHRRTKSTPSALRQNHKADILKGLLILISCAILMHFDASRMHSRTGCY